MADKNGVSEREHLEQIAKTSGRTPKGLEGPEFPDLAMRVWRVYTALHNRRGASMNGPEPLQYEAVQAWCNLHRDRLSLWEIDTIEALDALWLNIVREHKSG